jgi:hypothetical protein
LLAIFFLATVVCVGALSRWTGDEDREWWARASGWVLIAALAWLVVTGMSLYAPQLLFFGSSVSAWAFTTLGGLGGIVTFFAGRRTQSTAGRRPDDEPSTAGAAFNWVVAIAAPLFLVTLFVAMAALFQRLPYWWHLSANLPHETIAGFDLVVLAVLVVTCIAASYSVDINRFSLHAMYRNRLVRAYLGASRPRERLHPGDDCRGPNPFTGFDAADDLSMWELRAEKPKIASPGGSPQLARSRQRPFHVINAALNLVKGTRLAWQHRKAASFTVTPLHAGSAMIEDDLGGRSGTLGTIRGAYQDIATYGGRHGVLLGTAVAISGAAVSPNMGYHSSPIVTLLLALFNARLGWWLANPGRAGYWRWRKRGPGFAIRPYIAEAFGLTDDRNKYVYLSYGGHFENLGLYEMVLRRCSTIVVVDAGCDGQYQFEDLGNAVRKIRIDLGIPIDFVTPLSMSAKGGSNVSRFAVATIRYERVDAGAAPGTLLYLKPVVTGDETVDVRNYHATHTDFPHETTGDQWFDENQFETYRMLGLHTIEQWDATLAAFAP